MSEIDVENVEIIPPTKLDEIPVDHEALQAVEENNIPIISDTKWSDYVLTQFEDAELINGNPTVDGLRRVACKLLGDIVESVSKVIQAPSPDNDSRATVEHRVSFLKEDKVVYTFGDCADSFAGNTSEYSNYPTSIAATRAEGRALRKALHLRRVIAAEESLDTPVEKPGKINNTQISFINMMCSRHNINVWKLVNMGAAKYKKVEDIPYATAVKINKFLNEIQNDKRKIPDSISGYEPDWKESDNK